MEQLLERFPRTRPCPICRAACFIRITKKMRPYFHCDDCLVQVFVRGDLGIERLTKLGEGK